MQLEAQEDNRALLLRMFEELGNRGNIATAAEFMALDVKRHDLGALFPSATDVGGVKNFLGMMRAAIPDLHFEVHEVIASGDRVVVRFTLSGTHTGDLAGVSGTGRPVSMPCINIYRIADGKVAETWQLAGELSLLKQVGAYTPHGSTVV